MRNRDYYFVGGFEDQPTRALYRGYPDGPHMLVLCQVEVDPDAWERVEESFPDVSDYWLAAYNAAQRVGMTKEEWVGAARPMADVLDL